jgi:hypothetical protein
MYDKIFYIFVVDMDFFCRKETREMEGLEMTEKEQATFLIDTFTNLQRIKASEDRDHEIDYQLTVTRAKLEALGIVTEDLTIKK